MLKDIFVMDVTAKIATTRQDGCASITMQTCNLGSVDGDGYDVL
jgi:hypothetical protein